MIRVAALSRIKYIDPVPRETYIRLCEDAAAEAGRAGCDILLLPEHFDAFGSLETDAHDGGLYDPATDRSPLYRAIAEPVPGPMTERFGRICRRFGMYLIADYTELDGDRLYNTAVILDRQGNVAGKYRKSHLCGSEGRCFGITAGDELPVFDLDFGRIGIAICMDMFFPEVFRVLTLKGARTIFWPHQTYGPSEEMIMLQARCRALDYCCYLVGANFASPTFFAPYCSGHELTGRACIINPEGVPIADTGHLAGLAIATFDPEPSRRAKDIACIRKDGVDQCREDLLLMRRPALYGEITKSNGSLFDSPAADGVFINKHKERW